LLLSIIHQQLVQRINLEFIPKIESCVNNCTAIELCYAPNEHCNSIANLIYHLNGNVRQWVFQGLLGHDFERKRPEEFVPKEGVSKDALLTILSSLKADITKYATDITQEDLERTVSIQLYSEPGLSALIHVIEHFSYHTGQIALITKLLKNKDLEFYKGLAIN